VRRVTPRPPQEPGTLCGGLGYLCGSELKIRSHVVNLDLDGVTLVAIAVLPAALDELAAVRSSFFRSRSRVHRRRRDIPAVARAVS
jgi:hypothetical protein